METVVRYTYADYRRLPDDERWQLIRGKLVREPAPTPPHQFVCLEVARALMGAAEPSPSEAQHEGSPPRVAGPQVEVYSLEHRAGVVLSSPIDVVLSEEDVLQPDVIFISRQREDIITSESINGAPDLVVEILSPSTEARDRGVKMELYAAHGVREYWIVDPACMTVEVYRARPADAAGRPAEAAGPAAKAENTSREEPGSLEPVLALHAVYRPGQILTTPLIPGLALNPGRLFRRYL